jgi:hypothetical protein
MGEYSEVRSRRWAVGRGSLLTWSPLTRFYSSVARGCLLLLYIYLSQYIFETKFVFGKAEILSTLSHCVLLIGVGKKREHTRDDNNRIKLE